jgi:hypothetical protein
MSGIGSRTHQAFLRKGKAYRLAIALQGLEKYAPNGFVAETLSSYGFTGVQVSGSDGSRTAVGVWNPPVNPVPIDPRTITGIELLE